MKEENREIVVVLLVIIKLILKKIKLFKYQ